MYQRSIASHHASTWAHVLMCVPPLYKIQISSNCIMLCVHVRGDRTLQYASRITYWRESAAHQDTQHKSPARWRPTP